jgi:hypothetical protein
VARNDSFPLQNVVKIIFATEPAQLSPTALNCDNLNISTISSSRTVGSSKERIDLTGSPDEIIAAELGATFKVI